MKKTDQKSKVIKKMKDDDGNTKADKVGPDQDNRGPDNLEADKAEDAAGAGRYPHSPKYDEFHKMHTDDYETYEDRNAQDPTKVPVKQAKPNMGKNVFYKGDKMFEGVVGEILHLQRTEGDNKALSRFNRWIAEDAPAQHEVNSVLEILKTFA